MHTIFTFTSAILNSSILCVHKKIANLCSHNSYLVFSIGLSFSDV